VKEMKVLTLLATMICFLFTTTSYAEEHLPKTTMTVTLINSSNDTLTYTGVTDTNTENIFLVSPQVILPGSQIRITSVSNNYNVPDLSGNLHFTDSTGKTVTFHVTDPRQIHIGKSLKAVGNEQYIPTVFAAPENHVLMTGTTAISI
jgi:hypothetical protein